MKYRIFKPGESFGENERYQIIEKIGLDHREELYRVKDSEQDTLLALQLLPREIIEDVDLLSDFLRLLTLTQTLDHPNIIQPVSFDKTTNIPFFTMRNLEGKSLLEVLSEVPQGHLGLDKTLLIARQIGNALLYAHNTTYPDESGGESKSGIAHGDLKPYNIFLSDQNQVQVTQFCLEEFLRPVSQFRQSKSLPYISPEQYRGEDWDLSSDIFSLGIIIYYMLTGSPPFPNEGLCTQSSLENVEHIDIVPARLNEIIFKAFSFNKEDRFVSALEFVQELEKASHQKISIDKKSLAEQPGAKRKEKRRRAGKMVEPEAKKTKIKHNKMMVWAATVGLVIVFGVIFGFWLRAHQKETVSSARTTSIQSEEKIPPTATPIMAMDVGQVFITATLEDKLIDGATIIVDGQPSSGKTPFRITNLEAGSHEILLTFENAIGFLNFDLQTGEILKLHVPLHKRSAVLKIDFISKDANIFLDGKDTHKNTPATLIIPIGKHVISLHKDGFQPLSKDVDLTANTTRELIFDTLPKRAVRRQVPSPNTQTTEKKTLTPRITQSFQNDLGMTFVKIKTGTFKMGSPEKEPFRDNDEKRFTVHINSTYFMQSTEVTQGQWRSVMGTNPSKFKECGDQCPVENISWNKVQKFIIQLNQKLMKDGYSYRLPTEAEWEYAARSGGVKALYNGELVSPLCSPVDKILDKIAWFCGNSSRKTQVVGHKTPNSWGLYDMSGNVWEWCQDRYGLYPTTKGVHKDFRGTSKGRSRVIRGGCWNSDAKECRNASRASRGPGRDNNEIGFRLAATLK